MAAPGVLPWVVEDREPLLDLRIFRASRVRARSQQRPEHAASFVRLETPDWVNVIALTDDEQVVLVEQYRHGTEHNTLEIPGGMVDPGEDFVAAGLRELAEETGYAGEHAELIGMVEPNPAFLSNRCATLLVRGAKQVAPPSPDPNEELAVSTVPLARIRDMVRGGQITHALVVAAFYHLAVHEAES